MAFNHDFTAAFNRITSEHMKTLQEKGYAVMDGVFGEGWCRALREEIRWLHEQNLLLPNQIKFLEVNVGPSLLSRRKA